MGIRLDWEVESEAGWSEVGEDAAALAARKRRNRRLRIAALVLLAILATAGGTMGWRLYSIGRQLRADLRTIAELETRSLREGNRSTFLAMQADYEEWQRDQSRTFDDYQQLDERIQVTGKIISLEITADQARVVVEEIYDGKPYHVTWFYTRTDEGWRHVPPNPNHWGEQTSLETVHFRIAYHTQDEALAKRVAIQVDKWWDAACRVTDCLEVPDAPQIRIEADPLVDMGWATYNPNVLIIPSPGLGRVPADGSDDPTLFPTIASYLAEYWADSVIHTQLSLPRTQFSEVAWLRSELELYLNHRFDENAPRSGFFHPLVEKHGPSVVREVLAVMPHYEGVFSFPSQLEQITGTPADQLNVDWGPYLAQRLRGESALIRDGYVSEARLLYSDTVGRETEVQEGVVNFATEVAADPSTIELLSVRKVGELTWIEVRFTSRTPDGAQRIVYEPYRYANGQWVHVAALSSDWGAGQIEETSHIRLIYRDLDAPYAEGLAAYLEQAYIFAANDFEIEQSSLDNMDITITPNAFTHFSGNDMVIVSLYASGYDPTLTPSSYAQTEIARRLITHLLSTRIRSLPINHPISASFLTWEMDQRGLNSEAALSGLLDEHGRVGANWLMDQAHPLSFVSPYEDVDYAEARALVDVLVKRYGKQAVPTMLEHLGAGVNMDDWLMRGFGITFADVQAEWEAELSR